MMVWNRENVVQEDRSVGRGGRRKKEDKSGSLSKRMSTDMRHCRARVMYILGEIEGWPQKSIGAFNRDSPSNKVTHTCIIVGVSR